MLLFSTITLAIFAALIAGLSSWGVLFPQNLVSFVQSFMRRRDSIFVAVVARILLAALLWIVAPVSNTPTAFFVLAGIALLAAVGIAVVGLDRLQKLLEHVASWSRLAIRLQCLFGVVFGLFLIWSISPVWAAT